MIKRMYLDIFKDHCKKYRQMIMLSGPRQVGKTTTCKELSDFYFNWDRKEDREVILQGEDALAEKIGLNIRTAKHPFIILDELHHYPKWKQFLKGYFDTYGEDAHTIVTGSARFDLHKRGKGDSLMGRYFSFNMHPLSVGELLRPTLPKTEIAAPKKLSDEEWETLRRFGGFPEPFTAASDAFSRRWRKSRREQMIRTDIAKETGIKELDQLESLALVLAKNSGSQVVYSSLANDIQVSEVTIRAWIKILTAFFFGFTVPPWSKSLPNAIKKTPKWYLRDWSGIKDEGQKNETIMACHLLKAVDTWNDLGFGEYDLFYLRDKNQKEVDFLVTKDEAPWFMVEVKTSETKVAPSLNIMQSKLNAPYAFQVVADLPFEPVDAFDKIREKPSVISMRSFLSQLP